MNSFELNKILGAVLATCLALLALNIGAGALFAPEKPAKPGFDIAVKGHDEGGKAGAAKEPSQPIETLMASASAEKGQATSKQCGACHTFEKGGPNRVGPNLWGVVGGPKTHMQGFSYSQAMQGFAGKGPWDYAALDKFLFDPKADVPGTRMTFAGVKKTQDRANLVAWLRTQSDNPPPLP